MKKIILISLQFLTISITAQNLYMDAMVSQDSTVLRWVPVGLKTFYNGVENGYKIERFDSDQGKYNLLDTIHPLTITESERLAHSEPSDSLLLLAAYFLYGTDTLTSLKSSNILEGYEQFEQQELNYNFMLICADLSANAAKTMGLRYVDHTPMNSKNVLYRVTCTYPDHNQSDTAFFLARNTPTYFSKIEGLSTLQEDDEVKLSWSNTAYNSSYTAYNLFRANAENGPYNIINNAPIFVADDQAKSIFHTDSITIGNHYYYKIQGLTAFGTKGPLSDPHFFEAKNKEVAINFGQFEATGDHTGIHLKWKNQVINPDNLKQVSLLKSNSYEGPYHILVQNIGTNDSSYLDVKLDNYRHHYYRFVAFNRDGVAKYSQITRADYKDIIPPQPPAQLKGYIDSMGVSYLHWTPNLENDLKGYRLYKSNRLKGTYHHAHDLLLYSNVFEDTVGLNFLTEKVFYKVVAVDFNNNHSEYSSILTLSRPDTVAPAPAIIKNFKTHAKYSELKIAPSPSHDVQRMILVKQSNNSNMDSIDLDPASISYKDTSYHQGDLAHYHLITVDDASNSSKSKIVKIQSASRAFSPLEITLDLQDNIPTLSWKINSNDEGFTNFYLIDKGGQISFWFRSASASSSRLMTDLQMNKLQVAGQWISSKGRMSPFVYSDTITLE